MIGNTQIDIPCPKCETAFSVSISQIENGSTVECPKCRSLIKLSDHNGDLKRLDSKISNIFKKLGK